MDSTSTCSTCRFWKPRDEPGTGKCKWGPPIYLPSGANGPSRAAWPTTPANEVCGRWETYLVAKMSDFTRKDQAAGIEVFVQGRDPVVEKVLLDNGFKPVVPETPPMEEVKPAAESHPESPTYPTPDQVEAARGAVPPATNQIAQLVRGKRQPGQRLE